MQNSKSRVIEALDSSNALYSFYKAVNMVMLFSLSVVQSYLELDEHVLPFRELPLCLGELNESPVAILRDCSLSVFRSQDQVLTAM